MVIGTLAAGVGIAYSLRGVPDAEHVLFTSMRAASEHARAYAARVHVDVWVEQLGGRLLVGRFRRASMPRAPER